MNVLLPHLISESMLHITWIIYTVMHRLIKGINLTFYMCNEATMHDVNNICDENV